MIKQVAKKLITAILTLEAHAVLRKYKPGIIAVTGSVGKTSTKDMIYAALEEVVHVRKSIKSYNSEIGIPLTILGCESGWGSARVWIKNILKGLALIFLKNHYPKWLILEVGADRPGDIRKAARWIKPDIAVITSFGEVPVHVEFFSSPKAVIEEKAHLVAALKKDGLLVVNADDDTSSAMRHRFRGVSMTYGFGKNSAMRAERMEVMYDDGVPAGVRAHINYDGSIIPLRMNGVLGNQYIYSALAALAVGVYLNLNIVHLVQALEGYQGTPGRMRIIKGVKGSCIIDDTYNASPVAMEAALATLDEVKTAGMKIAILGDMLELGKHTAAEHKRIGKLAGKVCDMLLVVGLRARGFVKGALLGGLSEKNIIEFESSEEAGKYLQNILKEGDIVLVKGSQSMRMEKAVVEIMADPQKRKALLVRQEKEWETR